MAEEAVTNPLKKKKKWGQKRTTIAAFHSSCSSATLFPLLVWKKGKEGKERKKKKRKKHNAIAYSILLNSFLFSTIRVRHVIAKYVLRNTFWQRPERRKTEVRQTGKGQTQDKQRERERERFKLENFNMQG